MSSGKQRRLIQRSVYRGTSHMPKPAKEKHLRIIVSQTFQNGNEEIIKALAKRMDKQNWAVVLKALYMIHRCFRDGHPSFIESLRTISTGLFALRNFTMIAQPNHLYTIFVKKYASYLEEKVSVLRLLGLQFEKQKDIVKTVKGQEIFRVIPKLQSQLNALLNTKMRAQHVGLTLLIHRAYVLLMKDSLVLYSMLNEGILRLLDQFWKMNKSDASMTLNIYKLFVKETDALIGLYELGKTFIRNLPEIQKAETSIIEQMERYVESQADDNSNSRRKSVRSRSPDENSAAELNEDNNEYEVGETGGEYSDSGEADDDNQGEDSSGSGDEEEQEEDDDFFKTFLLSGGNAGGNPFMAALFANRPPGQSFSSPYSNPAQGRGAPMTNSQLVPSPYSSQPMARTYSGLGVQPRPASTPVINPFLSNPGTLGRTGSTSFATPQPYPAYQTAAPRPNVVINPFTSAIVPTPQPQPQPSFFPQQPIPNGQPNPTTPTHVVNPFLS